MAGPPATLDANDKRQTIFQYIQSNPGSHFNAIKKALGLKTGVLQYHLNVLLEKGMVKSQNEGNRKQFFPKGYNPRNIGERKYILNEVRRRYQLLSEKERLIFRLLVDEGPITLGELAAVSSIKKSRHVKPYLRNIEQKLGVIVKMVKKSSGAYCYIDFDRYSD